MRTLINILILRFRIYYTNYKPSTQTFVRRDHIAPDGWREIKNGTYKYFMPK